MTEERARLYDTALWLVDKLGEASERDDAVPAAEVFALAESVGRMILALRDGERARPARRAKWQVSADAVA